MFKVGQNIKEGNRIGRIVAIHSKGTADVLFDDMDYAIRRQSKNLQRINPIRRNGMKLITKTLFKEIIAKEFGEYEMDEFIRFENLPAPWMGDVGNFGLSRQKMTTKKGIQTIQTLGRTIPEDKWLPKQWLPHGSEADKRRYEEVFGGERFISQLGKDIQDNDTIEFLEWARIAFKSRWDNYIYDQIYDQNNAIQSSILAQIKKGAGAAGQGKKVRAMRKIKIIGKNGKPMSYNLLKDKDIVDMYLDEVKRVAKLEDATQRLYKGIPSDSFTLPQRVVKKGSKSRGRKTTTKRGPTRNIQPEMGEFYSAVSGLFLGFGSMEPRPLLGTSEKVEKSDGTKVEVKVMYLSPAKRSDRDFPDEYLRYNQIPIAMDSLAQKAGLFPSTPKFDKATKFGQKLQKQYEKARNDYADMGYMIYKKNPRNPKKNIIKLCHNPNTCPYAGACAGLCLIDSGRMGTNIEPATAGYMKTWYFFLYPLFFLRQLLTEVKRGSESAAKGGMSFFGRLNGTSDIPWERYIDMDLFREYVNKKITGSKSGEAFGGFYDYNKYPYEFRSQAGDWINGQCPESYDLTYSISEAIVAKGSPCAFKDSAFAEAIIDALVWVEQGFRVATVVEYWKQIPLRNFNLQETRLLQQYRKGTITDGAKLLQAQELDYYDKRNARAGEVTGNTTTVFDKLRERGAYVLDNQGRFVVSKKEEKMSISDFNELCRTSVNSLDLSNRAQNILIIDGDETDFRFNDPKPAIVILKPKGLKVTPKKNNKYGMDKNGQPFEAGQIYVNVPPDKGVGVRYNKAVKSIGQQFIMTGATVLELQRLFLQAMTRLEYNRMYPATMQMLELKGDFVYKSNLTASLPKAEKKRILEAARIYGLNVITAAKEQKALSQRQPKAIKNRKNRKKNPMSSEIEVLYDPARKLYFMVNDDGLVDIDGTQTWKTKRALSSHLGKAGLTINRENFVIMKR